MAYSSLTTEILETAASIDWQDLGNIEVNGGLVLTRLSAKDVLGELMDHFAGAPQLWPMCEEEYGLTKYVLHDDPQGRFRLRLHIMKPTSIETPHSHRMNFTTRLLKGEYVQYVYSAFDDGQELLSPKGIVPVLRHRVSAGMGYALQHSVIHALEVTEPTVSMMLRGPAFRKRAININLTQNDVWWQRSDRFPANASSRKLHVQQTCAGLRRDLSAWDLI